MESSVAAGGKKIFYTGNWFAARSNTGGATGADWQYMNPYADFPSFCCDQVAIYDASHDIYFWLRMGAPDANGENVFKLSVSTNAFQGGYWTYSIAPTNVDGTWTNQFWNYPHMQLSADYLYITCNMFSQSGTWTRSVVLRLPLQPLSEAAVVGSDHISATNWFTLVPVSGAHHTMYFASNWPSTVPQNSRIRIYWWTDHSLTYFWVERDVTPWTATGKGDCHCGPVGGSNWTARTDQRLLTGARYSISSNNLTIRGRKVVAWWWNVAEGGGFAHPYIDAAAFYEDDMTQLAGNQGRPYMWNSVVCYAYPSVAPNARQDLGIAIHYGTEFEGWTPDVGYGMADDYVNAPPGWAIFTAIASNALPADNKWGNYNTVRPHAPVGNVWAAASHFIQQSTDCTNCSKPVYFLFGRQRDQRSLGRWWNK